jgi:hypothetical protein
MDLFFKKETKISEYEIMDDLTTNANLPDVKVITIESHK